MIDKAFIKEILRKGLAAKEKVIAEFTNLTTAQFNWKSSADSWSIAQCLQHLVVSDSAYFPDLNRIVNGNYKMSCWQRYSPLSKKFGQILKNQLQEQATKKMTAPKKIRPTAGKMNLDLIEDYCKNLDDFLDYISKCTAVDIDKIIISSPITSIITYSLRDAFRFLIQHEHRHINQAIRVKANEKFPK
jgi:uncharacterized damage-inducible protein DinB